MGQQAPATVLSNYVLFSTVVMELLHGHAWTFGVRRGWQGLMGCKPFGLHRGRYEDVTSFQGHSQRSGSSGDQDYYLTYRGCKQTTQKIRRSPSSFQRREPPEQQARPGEDSERRSSRLASRARGRTKADEDDEGGHVRTTRATER